MTDFSALGIQVISFDSDGTALDVSGWVEQIAPIATTAIDLVGYVKTTTTLLLVNSDASLLETRFNPRWTQGNKIEIWLRDSTGTFILHRALRILDRFFDTGRSPQSQRQGSPSLELELGDLFALRDLRSPPPNDVKVPRNTPGEEVSIISQISNWLEAFGLPPVTVLPRDETPPGMTVTRVRYQGGGSILEHIGRLLYLNTRFILWVDPQERVRVRRVGLRVAGYDFNDPTFQIGTQDENTILNFGLTNPEETGFIAERTRSFLSYAPEALAFLPMLASDINMEFRDRDCLINERSKNERERPAGLIRVAGTATYREAYTDPGDETIVTNEDDFRTTMTIGVDTSALSQIFTREGTVQVPGALDEPFAQEIGQFRENDEFLYGGAIASTPNSNPFLEDNPGLSAHLLQRTLTTEEQRREPDGSLTPLRVTKEVTTKYTYVIKSEFLQGIRTRSAEVADIVTIEKVRPIQDPEDPFSDPLKVVQTRTQTWREQREGIYYYVDTTIRPEDEENRRYSQTQSSVGRSTPPATQWVPQSQVVKDRPIYAEFALVSPPDADGLLHQRTYNVGPYLDSNRNAAVLARHLGALLVGRSETQSLGFRMPDDWLADPIPAPWVAIAPALYLLDTPVVILEKTRAYLGGSGIYMGIWDGENENLTAPYEALPLVQSTTQNLVLEEEGSNFVFENGDNLILEEVT